MRVIALLFAIVFAMSCSADPEVAERTDDSVPSVELSVALGGMEFDKPVALVFADESTDSGYMVEQSGRILLVSLEGDSWSATEVLDIEDRVNDRGREEGLLGLALDPDFELNGHLYVNYTAPDPRRTVVSRFTMSPNGSGVADPRSELVILEVRQPYSNHNGGQVLFGLDEFLYIGLGDGGSAGDPRGNGQDPGTLLGSIARIDVSTLDTTGTYDVPADNPFLGTDGARAEIWAYGLRNPWRFSFDRETGELWAGDVGQNRREEVNVVKSGLNYGWNIMEGSVCYRADDGSCEREGLEHPVVDYGHAHGCSVTGGYVYRGQRLPWLYGKYVFGDFCSGKVWAFDPDTAQMSELMDTSHAIASFAEDGHGELYVVSLDGGVYAFVAAESSGE